MPKKRRPGIYGCEFQILRVNHQATSPTTWITGVIMDFVKEKLEACLRLLNRSCATSVMGDISCLNDFCAEFFDFSNILHKFMSNQLQNEENNGHAEMICLCLTQVMVCIRHMECTIKAEIDSGAAILASRQFFLDRMRWCLKRLYTEVRAIQKGSSTNPAVEQSFVKLVDSILDALSSFSNENTCDVREIQLSETHKEPVSISNYIRRTIDLVLSQTLAFANVALEQDKKALSALCQKVLRDCNAFQAEFEMDQIVNLSNHSNQKLKAMSLEQALYHLEDYINEALLRLVYTCFLDYEKFSVEKLRNVLSNILPDDTAADEIIADFDVNVDRTTQIGIFAIAFSPNLKMKTIVRSCLASLESLDTSLVPALQTNGSNQHSELLEQHFNEEITKFKTALLEIIDSHAFVGCYLEMLTSGISAAEKNFDKLKLQDLAQMGGFISEHFQLAVNKKVLLTAKCNSAHAYFQQFNTMLRECRAILMCAAQVEPKRIIKRFKILRTTLRKLRDSIEDKRPTDAQLTEIVNARAADKISINDGMLESLGIMPTACSILYDSVRQRCRVGQRSDDKTILSSQIIVEENNVQQLGTTKSVVFGSIRRKDSLRTVMFKRQNLAESQRLYNEIGNRSASLQISDILDQLNNMSAESTYKS